MPSPPPQPLPPRGTHTEPRQANLEYKAWPGLPQWPRKRSARAGADAVWRRSHGPRRASAGEPATTHGGARRPHPGGGRLNPETSGRGGHPGGAAEPPGPVGVQDKHLRNPRGRNAGPRGRGGDRRRQGAQEGAQTAHRARARPRLGRKGRPGEEPAKTRANPQPVRQQTRPKIQRTQTQNTQPFLLPR